MLSVTPGFLPLTAATESGVLANLMCHRTVHVGLRKRGLKRISITMVLGPVVSV